MLVDDSMDVSMFYNITEEEEKKEKENDGKKELIFSNYINPESNYIGYKNTIVDHYNLKDYTTPHLNLILPPPEVHI